MLPFTLRVIDAVRAGRVPLLPMRHQAKRSSLVVATLTFVVLTKLVSVPMRLVGAIVSIVPIAGNAANDAIGAAANAVDDVPI